MFKLNNYNTISLKYNIIKMSIKNRNFKKVSPRYNGATGTIESL